MNGNFRIAAALTALALLVTVGAVAQESGGEREALIEEGRNVYLARCEYCHGGGVQKGASMMLQRRYQGAVPAVLHERTNLPPEYIRLVVRTNTSGMAPIRTTEVSESQLDAVIAYLTRNNP